MEDDIYALSHTDLILLYETFLVVRNPNAYQGSEVQRGFLSLFAEADRDFDGFVERGDFPLLIDGFFSSKHMRASSADYEEYFKKIDLNNDGKISFEDYDVFIRIVYETEYIPALEREIARRKAKGSKQQLPKHK